MKLLKIICSVLCIGLLSACGNKTDKKEEATTEEHHENSNLVSLTPQQIMAADIRLGAIEMKNLVNSISVNGTLAVPNQNKALVTSLAPGVLRSLNVQPGNPVHKGQVIGTIANTELSGIQQQVVAINAQLKYGEQEQQRLKELVAGNAAPLKNLQKIEAEISGLKAQRTALQKQLSALGIPFTGDISATLAITAPISGTISEVTAQIGSNIDNNTPIAQIINNSELHLDLFVYEKDLPKVAAGQTIHFTLTNNPGKEYDATIYSIGTAFTNETKAIPIHARVTNEKSGLIEGMSVTARISLGEAVYQAVPDEAIVNDGGKQYVFIFKSNADKSQDQSYERIQVMIGASDVGFTQINPVSELPLDSKIVIKGAFFLMAKMTNTGEKHDH